MESFHQLTYPRINLKDNTLGDVLAAMRLVGNACPRNTPERDLGSLDRLPPELLQTVLLQLDLRSFTEYRMVNCRAMLLADSISQYKAIIAHAPTALQGILSIGTSRWITCEILYKTICTAKCESCDDFGGYIYLLTCKRVCFLCFSRKDIYLPCAIPRRKYRLNPEVLDSIPHMSSVPGVYSPNEKKRLKKLRLFDRKSVMACGSMGCEPEKFDGKSGNPLWFMAIVQAPTLHHNTGKIEHGAYCTGCRRSYDQKPYHFRRKFTETSFDSHLQECGSIKNGKHQRN